MGRRERKRREPSPSPPAASPKASRSPSLSRTKPQWYLGISLPARKGEQQHALSVAVGLIVIVVVIMSFMIVSRLYAVEWPWSSMYRKLTGSHSYSSLTSNGVSTVNIDPPHTSMYHLAGGVLLLLLALTRWVKDCTPTAFWFHFFIGMATNNLFRTFFFLAIISATRMYYTGPCEAHISEIFGHEGYRYSMSLVFVSIAVLDCFRHINYGVLLYDVNDLLVAHLRSFLKRTTLIAMSTVLKALSIVFIFSLHTDFNKGQAMAHLVGTGILALTSVCHVYLLSVADKYSEADEAKQRARHNKKINAMLSIAGVSMFFYGFFVVTADSQCRRSNMVNWLAILFETVLLLLAADSFPLPGRELDFSWFAFPNDVRTKLHSERVLTTLFVESLLLDEDIAAARARKHIEQRVRQDHNDSRQRMSFYCFTCFFSVAIVLMIFFNAFPDYIFTSTDVILRKIDSKSCNNHIWAPDGCNTTEKTRFPKIV